MEKSWSGNKQYLADLIKVRNVLRTSNGKTPLSQEEKEKFVTETGGSFLYMTSIKEALESIRELASNIVVGLQKQRQGSHSIAGSSDLKKDS